MSGCFDGPVFSRRLAAVFFFTRVTYKGEVHGHGGQEGRQAGVFLKGKVVVWLEIVGCGGVSCVVCGFVVASWSRR